MAGVAGAIAVTVEELNAVDDLSAASDPADLNAPAVLVTPGAIRPGEFLDGSGNVELRLDLVAQDIAWQDATSQLDAMLDKVVALGYVLVGDVLPISLILASTAAPLPAWRVTVLSNYATEE